MAAWWHHCGNTVSGMAEVNTRPDLVLVHGWGMHSGVFAPWLGYLETHWRVHLVDLPGHGDNRDMPLAGTAPEAAAQLAGLTGHLPRATWLGWSLGGVLALQMALQQPQRMERLVMLCASPCFVRRPHWPEGMDAAVLEQFGRELQQDAGKTLQRFMALEVLGCANERSLLRTLKALVENHQEPEPSVLQAGLSLLLATDLTSRLPALNTPSLWLAGRRDRLVMPAAVRRSAVLSGGDYCQLAGAGHAPFLTHGALVAQQLHDFAHQKNVNDSR